MSPQHVETAAECIATIHKAAYRSNQAFFDSVGITMPQALVVCYVEEKVNPKMTAIAEESGVTTAAMTGMIDRLSELGYVAREHDAKDRRVEHVVLTKKGQSLYDEIHRVRVATFQRVFSELPEEDVKIYVSTLERFVTLIEAKEVFSYGKK
jgi:DNA-binding MarR family transcriptional regulator